MNDVVPTVKIKDENGDVAIINLSDYDAKKHILATDELTPLKPLEPGAAPALYGSSIQPSTWNLPNGEVLQLGTMVAEAHKRSGLTVEGWNDLPNDDREKRISDVVVEMVPAPEPSFKIKKGRKGFIVLDSAGKEISEWFENEADAEAQRELLEGK